MDWVKLVLVLHRILGAHMPDLLDPEARLWLVNLNHEARFYFIMRISFRNRLGLESE